VFPFRTCIDTLTLAAPCVAGDLRIAGFSPRFPDFLRNVQGTRAKARDYIICGASFSAPTSTALRKNGSNSGKNDSADGQINPDDDKNGPAAGTDDSARAKSHSSLAKIYPFLWQT